MAGLYFAATLRRSSGRFSPSIDHVGPLHRSMVGAQARSDRGADPLDFQEVDDRPAERRQHGDIAEQAPEDAR